MAQELKPFHESVVIWIAAECDGRYYHPVTTLARISILCSLVRATIVSNPAQLVDQLMQIQNKLSGSDERYSVLGSAISDLQHRVSAETCGNG